MSEGASRRLLLLLLCVGSLLGVSASAQAAGPYVQYTAFRGYGTDNLHVYNSASGLSTNTNQGMRPGSSPSIATTPSGAYVVAFVGAGTDNLHIYNSVTQLSIDTHQGIASGTSPSIATLPDGAYVVAFRAAGTDNLHVYDSRTGLSVNQNNGIHPGTSPSIAAWLDGGWVVAFRGYGTSTIYVRPSDGLATSTSQGIESGTSPSIAVAGSRYFIAFRGYGTDDLHVYDSATSLSTDTDQALEDGSSPSIATLSDAKYVVSYLAADGDDNLHVFDSETSTPKNTFQGVYPGTNPETAVYELSTPANDSVYYAAFRGYGTDNLHLYDSSVGGSWDTGKGIKPGTSPSLTAVIPGGVIAAFVGAGTNTLHIYKAATGQTIPTGQGVHPGTSPGIAAFPDGNFVAAFHGYGTDNLYVYDSRTGLSVDQGHGIQPGTSPSIAVLPNGSWAVVFQGYGTNTLYVRHSNGSVTNTNQGIHPGSSPSIAPLPNGNYVIAFTGYGTGQVHVYQSAVGYSTNLNQAIKPGSSPSISQTAAGGYVVAFIKAGTDILYHYSSFSGFAYESRQGVYPGTSVGLAVCQFRTSCQYGGPNHSIDTDPEIAAVRTALGATGYKDESPGSVWSGIAPGDQPRIYPTSWTYGGTTDRSVNSFAELDLLAPVLTAADEPGSRALLDGLSPADFKYVWEYQLNPIGIEAAPSPTAISEPDPSNAPDADAAYASGQEYPCHDTNRFYIHALNKRKERIASILWEVRYCTAIKKNGPGPSDDQFLFSRKKDELTGRASSQGWKPVGAKDTQTTGGNGQPRYRMRFAQVFETCRSNAKEISASLPDKLGGGGFGVSWSSSNCATFTLVIDRAVWKWLYWYPASTEDTGIRWGTTSSVRNVYYDESTAGHCVGETALQQSYCETWNTLWRPWAAN